MEENQGDYDDDQEDFGDDDYVQNYFEPGEGDDIDDGGGDDEGGGKPLGLCPYSSFSRLFKVVLMINELSLTFVIDWFHLAAFQLISFEHCTRYLS